MTPVRLQHPPSIFTKPIIQSLVFLLVVALLGNLNALVDAFFHPEIEYFDEEHLLVGGITALVSGLLFGMAILYARHLEQALQKITLLEAFLPICANCKKIKTAGNPGSRLATWEPIEAYISARTNTQFSHSICPDCLTKLYPEYSDQMQPHHHQ